VEAGRQLLTGFELAVGEVSTDGGIDGRATELVAGDTAGDASAAVAAVEELASLDVVAVAGKYHSAVAGGAAQRADALGTPFLRSSAVLDALTEQPSNWVDRLASLMGGESLLISWLEVNAEWRSPSYRAFTAPPGSASCEKPSGRWREHPSRERWGHRSRCRHGRRRSPGGTE
jgi:hypothetical protein